MAIIFEVKVIPSSGRQAWTIEASGLIKCFLKSAPEKGRANKELLTLLAKLLHLPVQSVTIMQGETGRKKRIKVDAELSYEAVLDKLGLPRQQSLV